MQSLVPGTNKVRFSVEKHCHAHLAGAEDQARILSRSDKVARRDHKRLLTDSPRHAAREGELSLSKPATEAAITPVEATTGRRPKQVGSQGRTNTLR